MKTWGNPGFFCTEAIEKPSVTYLREKLKKEESKK